jgi:hypothetical protein
MTWPGCAIAPSRQAILPFVTPMLAGEILYRNGKVDEGLAKLTLALTDHFSPRARIMIAQVPLAHVSTIYTHVGDLFAWLCIASLLIMIAVALRVIR